MLEAKNYEEQQEPKDNSSEFEYPEHLSESVLKGRSCQWKIIRGTRKVSSFNPFKGTVTTGFEGELSTIHLPDRIHLNRAFKVIQL